MAIHAHSTTAPAPQPGLLPFIFRPTPPVDDLRSADELLDEIRREIDQQDGAALNSEGNAVIVAALRTEPDDTATGVVSREDTLLLKSQGKLDLTAGLLAVPAPLPSLSTAFSRRRAIFGAVALNTAAEANARHMRWYLEAAADHGAALLVALGLPLLTPRHRATIGDALDLAISTLDDFDGDPDLEPWLAGSAHFATGCTAAAIDAEDDSEEDEATALESFGRGFVRAGEDDAEDSHDAEPFLGARNPTWGSLGDSVTQVGWDMDSDDTDREHDPSDAEPYLSAVEFDGYGDNWGRSGQPTMGRNWTDVEDVNEDGAQCRDEDEPFWSLDVGCAIGEAAHA